MAAREVQPRSAILVHNLTTGSQSVVGCTEVVSASPDSRILVFQQLAANECITHFQGKVHIFLIIAFLEAHVLHLTAERLSRERVRSEYGVRAGPLGTADLQRIDQLGFRARPEQHRPRHGGAHGSRAGTIEFLSRYKYGAVQ